MKLKHRRFNISPNRRVERDTEGRFYLHDGTGERKELDRNEARKLLNRQIVNDKRNEFQFISEEEAVKELDELNAFFDKCDDLPGPKSEPDWEEQLELIKQSKGSGTTNT